MKKRTISVLTAAALALGLSVGAAGAAQATLCGHWTGQGIVCEIQ